MWRNDSTLPAALRIHLDSEVVHIVLVCLTLMTPPFRFECFKGESTFKRLHNWDQYLGAVYHIAL